MTSQIAFRADSENDWLISSDFLETERAPRHFAPGKQSGMMHIQGIPRNGRRAEVKWGGHASGGEDAGAVQIARGLRPECAIVIVIISPWVGHASAKDDSEQREEGCCDDFPCNGP